MTPRPSMQRVGTSGHPTATRDAALGDAEAEALSVTHWFESEQDGDPYTATIRFAGQRIGVSGKPGPREEPHNPVRVRVTAGLAALVLVAATGMMLANAG